MRSKLDELISEAYLNCELNGYHPEKYSTHDLAEDMNDFDSDLSVYSIEEIQKAIERFRSI